MQPAPPSPPQHYSFAFAYIVYRRVVVRLIVRERKPKGKTEREKRRECLLVVGKNREHVSKRAGRIRKAQQVVPLLVVLCHFFCCFCNVRLHKWVRNAATLFLRHSDKSRYCFQYWCSALMCFVPMFASFILKGKVMEIAIGTRSVLLVVNV